MCGTQPFPLWQVSVQSWIQLPASQLTLWTCSQTSRGHTCLPSLAAPHRSVTRSPFRPELEAISGSPLEQVAWLTPQGQQYTFCWPLETSRYTWTLRDDATVLDNYALTMTADHKTDELEWSFNQAQLTQFSLHSRALFNIVMCYTYNIMCILHIDNLSTMNVSSASILWCKILSAVISRIETQQQLMGITVYVVG